MKSLMLFAQVVLEDLGTRCGISTTRDIKTVTSRFEHEGLSFLTITLADFGKDFQKSLDLGSVGHDQYPGFSRYGGLPRFLGGFLDRVFDRKTGRLLNEPCMTSVWAIRQFCLMWSKIRLPCTPERESKAFGGYIECEKEIRRTDAAMDPELLDRFHRIGLLLWGDVFADVDRMVYEHRLIPKHGPGNTADKLVANQKWRQSEWPVRLDKEFPAGEFLLPNWRYHEYLSDVDYLEPGAERPVRVVSVPKTQKTPRIIAIEPTAMQYMQQALLAAFREALEGHDIPRCFVGNEDQVPNRRLAQRGSENGTLATLDLREASDRVSNQHVRSLLRDFPNLAGGVEASRSRKADVPGYGVVRLAKFASMGSALTFVMEEIVFTTIIFLAFEDELNRPLTRRDLRGLKGQVRVFGDDIIVPSKIASSVARRLEDFGLLVNRDKSFWTGRFRESCGGDYYMGDDITVVRVRSLLPTHRLDSEELVSTASLRNQLYIAGLWKSARWLDGILEKIIPWPATLPTSPILGKISVLGYDTQRMDNNLHRPLVKGLMVDVRLPVNSLDDVPALMKVLVRSASKEAGDDVWRLPTTGDDHLLRSGRPRNVNTKIGWGVPY